MTLVVFRWTKKDVKSHIFIGIGRNMSIEKVRFQQLRYILEEEFDNNREKLSGKLNISLSSLSKYVSNGKNRRYISNSRATNNIGSTHNNRMSSFIYLANRVE